MTGWGPRVYEPSGGAAGAVDLTTPGNTSTPDPAGSVYSQVSAVASGVLTDIITWIVPATPIVHLIRIEFGGTNIGRYWLYFGSSIEAQHIVWFNGQGLSAKWEFDNGGGGGLAVTPSTIVKVKIQHGRPFSSDHFARIHYREVN